MDMLDIYTDYSPYAPPSLLSKKQKRIMTPSLRGSGAAVAIQKGR